MLYLRKREKLKTVLKKIRCRLKIVYTLHQILHVVLCLVQKVNWLHDYDLRNILWKVQLQDCLSLVTNFTFPVPRSRIQLFNKWRILHGCAEIRNFSSSVALTREIFFNRICEILNPGNKRLTVFKCFLGFRIIWSSEQVGLLCWCSTWSGKLYLQYSSLARLKDGAH